MHYLTLQKIYKSSNNKMTRKIIRKLDAYIFFNEKNHQKIQIHPNDLVCDLEIDNNKDKDTLIYILHLAKDMGMFKVIYEAYCPERLLPIAEVSPSIEKYTLDEDCPYCGACEHVILNKDFVVSFLLKEKPAYKRFFDFLFGKRICQC